ncbi:TfoX/Sxy family protein [Aestuariimicrobium sp. T2.26MG-19.2B]|uniref:TfoX/Sxy family protein n=1 Tax=Aestuariimicrobium sp. T2.26MG-19.2B TaxID=3040679 RepID=UPI0024775E3B|nr:TfoX/Sxy family protein [Aestuariimicrobium sp. T2.26MG-19.2B]CAI9410919.1 hypothetical protein AESSP_02540 [Aestuariimicrobium sp. T2.26MG-19.2B]
MPYDPVIADRLRAALAGVDGVSEKRMFGGVGFMVNGTMAVAASSTGGVMLRSDPDDSGGIIDGVAITEMEMKGRPMKGWLAVLPEAVATDEDLQRIVDHGVTAARSLPSR